MRFLKIWLVSLGFVLYSPVAAERFSEEFFQSVIEKETEYLQGISHDNTLELANGYATRAESYLILGNYEAALADFYSAIEQIINSSSPEARREQLRAFCGVFLTLALLGDYSSVQELYDFILPRIGDSMCLCNTTKRDTPVLCSNTQKDWPVLGPNQVPRSDCLDYARGTAKQLKFLIAAIPDARIQVLASSLIDELANEAARCCLRGGSWKGCVQQLVNKFHYWNQLGIPSDPSYYTGAHFM